MLSVVLASAVVTYGGVSVLVAFDALPHNGTVLTVLQVSGLTHRESYFDMVMTVIVSVIVAFVAVIVLGSVFGSF